MVVTSTMAPFPVEKKQQWSLSIGYAVFFVARQSSKLPNLQGHQIWYIKHDELQAPCCFVFNLYGQKKGHRNRKSVDTVGFKSWSLARH